MAERVLSWREIGEFMKTNDVVSILSDQCLEATPSVSDWNANMLGASESKHTVSKSKWQQLCLKLLTSSDIGLVKMERVRDISGTICFLEEDLVESEQFLCLLEKKIKAHTLLEQIRSNLKRVRAALPVYQPDDDDPVLALL
eukprot:Filipodium_phascolosomae@DN925_c0_g1_i1.p1